MKRVRVTAVLAGLALLCTTPAALAATALDPAYGDGGTVVLPPLAADDTASGARLARQSRGVVAVTVNSETDPSTGTSRHRVVARRLDASGHVDRRFGQRGLAVLDLAQPGRLADVAVMADDRVYVLASTGEPGPGRRVVLSRLRHDGRPDGSFGSRGTVVSDLSSQNAAPRAVVPTADGGAYVALDGDTLAGDDFVLARYTRSGALDRSFGQGGVSRVDLGGDEHVEDLVAGPQGSSYVVGRAFDGFLQRAAVVRLLPDGRVDESFAERGVLMFAPGVGEVTDASVLPSDGGVVVAGEAYGVEGTYGFVARFTSRGRLDPVFANRGVLVVDDPAEDDGASVRALSSDGDLLVTRRIGFGPFLGQALQVDGTTGAVESSSVTDLGEFLVRDVLADGEGLLVGGTGWLQGGEPQEVVQRYR